jgi:hypothetical protein
LFCDDKFKATDHSIWFNSSFEINQFSKDIIWKRAKDMIKKPQLTSINNHKTNRYFSIQGELANYSFISACVSIAQNLELINHLVPLEQQLFGNNYYGVVICSFWQFNKWKNLIIDDTLPTRNGELLFAKFTDHNMFWLAYLEKAYAK